jgi:hypothetical protein
MTNYQIFRDKTTKYNNNNPTSADNKNDVHKLLLELNSLGVIVKRLNNFNDYNELSDLIDNIKLT